MSLTPKILEKRLKVDNFTLHSTYLPANTPRQDRAVAVILHGAGQSDSTRHQRLAEHFIDKGVSVISLDFVGHGKTGGNVGDNNLAKRTLHALAVIKHWIDETTPLILCGFSMSGHTALRLSALFGTRVKSLGLFCPAVYAAEAEDIHFGQPFTEIIRKPESWRSSLALQDAYNFRGRAAIIIGTEDEVIPTDIILALEKALMHNAAELRLQTLDGASHQLAKWLAQHEEVSEDIVEYLIEGEK